MNSDDLDVARHFLEALAAAAATGDRQALEPFLAPDVEWVTPKRDLAGIEEVHEQLTWLAPPDNLTVEFDEPKLTEMAEGHIVSDVREVYRTKDGGDLAYVRERRIDLRIRDGKITRYEMRVVG
jgi:ketosteroid isomerase-like protein